MDSDHQVAVPSTASILGHPIHPMLVPFPIAFFIGALATDVAAWLSGDPFWARVSFWLIAGGVGMGVLAALAGLTDFLTIKRVRALNAARFHFLGNATVMVLSIISLTLRWGDPVAGLWPWGLVLSAAVTALLGVTGWLGGELVYKHGIGMQAGSRRSGHADDALAANSSAAERPDLYRKSGGRAG